MKGFGLQKEKRLLVKIISSQNSKAYQEFIGKLYLRLGIDRTTDLVINEVLPTLPPEDYKWCYETMLGQTGYEHMKQEASNALYQVLVEKGYTPGTDFSIHPQGGIILSDNASEALLVDVPENFRAKIRAELKTTIIPNALDTLEEHLGVPFLEQLLQRVSARLTTFTDSEAATYLAVMTSGFQERTQIELFPILLNHVAQAHPERIQGIVHIMKKLDDLDSSEQTHKVMLDLVCAAGGENELMPHPDRPNDPDECVISRRGMEIFAQVWHGERSVYEIIGALDAAIKKHQEERQQS
ncbi:hypothetical protein WA1_02225 [Scytonema hofmannii PCC 7110]|uniref:Uncharacterized protein n=1 Tax=Scytonema hofmannii PCC 7110 TaxID=128403 RepID=A0A139XH43_9CYAN|nr:hypothetical protein [Scytonema hofmannii]KYC43983.1 hypothetical protein WA1_02225 [Scytonema hofmannii PCC 7110]